MYCICVEGAGVWLVDLQLSGGAPSTSKSVPVRARVRSGHMTCVGRIHGNENCLATKLMLHHRQQKLHLIIKQAARCATRKLSLIQLIKTKAHSTHKLHFYSLYF